MEFFFQEALDGAQRLRGLLPRSLDLDPASLSGRESQQPHDASSIDCLAVFRDLHVGGEPIHRLDQERGCPGVEAEFILDL